MEMWLVPYWRAHPKATRHTLIEVSRPERLASYAWLFNPRLKRAQDKRIRIMLEEDAFAHIQKRWARLGYPFPYLTPSYATAIGSSADRPDALAALVGIILADGRKLPLERFSSIELAANTPYETLLTHDDNVQAPQVLDPAIAEAMKSIMLETMSGKRSTAAGVKGVYLDAKGEPLPIGGKTGTGDQRYDEFGAGGRIISSRRVNRTGTLVFYIGNRFFGVIVAHVGGNAAADFTFSSAIAVQMLRDLAPIINPLVNRAAPEPVAAARQAPPVSLTQPLPP
ncbi:MAG: hypothetical protein KGI97_06040 [Alphaproteobacteria bacterium]|nr:hypothetical protein [Alphaproteobacteria bacterium]